MCVRVSGESKSRLAASGVFVWLLPAVFVCLNPSEASQEIFPGFDGYSDPSE